MIPGRLLRSAATVAWLLAPGGGTGCDRGDSAASISTVRDSAGVAIVENVPPAVPAIFATLASTPRVDIGSLEGAEPYQLFRVGGVARLPDGSIAVADGGSQEIRVFDDRGQFVRAFGREGEGPGEFKGVGPIIAVGTDVQAYDWSLQRVSVFDAHGSFVAAHRVELPSGDPPMVVGGLADGTWLSTKSFMFSPSNINTVVRDTLPYVLLRPGTGEAVELGRFPGIEFHVYGNERMSTASSLLFGRMTAAGTGAGRIAIGPNDRYEVRIFDGNGRLEQIVRRAHTPRPVTQADIDAGKAKRLEDAPNDNFRRQVEQLYLEMPIPATMPAFDELRIDALGFLWVRDPLSPVDATASWHVFGPEGRWVGVVETPTDLGVRMIGDDFVLATWTDDLGVEHVQVYGLDRTVGERP